jgi:hypothetical protein
MLTNQSTLDPLLSLDRGTTNTELDQWVADVAALTCPQSVVWFNGSAGEVEQLTDLLVEEGKLIRLNPQLRPLLHSEDDVRGKLSKRFELVGAQTIVRHDGTRRADGTNFDKADVVEFAGVDRGKSTVGHA